MSDNYICKENGGVTWTLTSGLRWEKKESLESTEYILEQLWLGSDGSQKWERVPWKE